jgi:hypothetical protein
MEGIMVPGHHEPNAEPTAIDAVRVGPDYFEVVGVPITAGRGFTDDDVKQERRVVIVNETMGRQYWAGTSPIGQQIYLDGFRSPAYEVVGVARDHKVRSVGEAPRPYLHLPAGASRSLGLIVRTAQSSTAALPMLRETILRLEPDVVFTADVSAEDIAATTVAPTRIGALILGAFGVLALVLAAVGVYGVVAYSVSRRTREIGLRIAIGATRLDVLRLVLRQGLALAGIGALLGVAASAPVFQLMSSGLAGLGGLSYWTLVIVPVGLLAVTLGACWLPARRAARIDPTIALRAD